MKKGQFSETQILRILKELESGVPLGDIVRQHGVGESTVYNWRSKYSGMTESEVKRLKQLEEENRRLKHMYAELSIDYRVLKDIVEKSCKR